MGTPSHSAPQGNGIEMANTVSTNSRARARITGVDHSG